MAPTNQNQQGGREQSGGGNQGGNRNQGDTGNRGFASMDDDKQRAIAAEGGRAAHEQGSAHEFDSDEAREAGRKGGEARAQNVAQNADRDQQGQFAGGNDNSRGGSQSSSSGGGGTQSSGGSSAGSSGGRNN